MVFYLPVVFVIFFCLGKRHLVKLARWWLVFASVCFYSYWNIDYVPLLLSSIGWNYTFGKLLQKGSYGKALLALGIGGNIALLGYYKYVGFFIETYNAVGGFAYDVPQIILPLGISFFTFTQTAYLIDAYRGETKVREGGHWAHICSL